MPIIISAKDFTLTPSLKEYVERSLGALQRHSPEVTDIKVELDVDHNQHKGMVNRVEMSARIGATYLKAGQKAEHMHEAIDLCVPKLIRQAEKNKNKRLRM